MRNTLRHCSLRAALFWFVSAQSVLASAVTVNVTTKSGSEAHDTVIVFDPLDAMPAASHDTAIIDQINKRFVPRVLVVRTGTAITFPNSDRIRHQVYSFSKPNVFTLKLYAGLAAAPVNFDHPGLVVLGCNIHDKMVGFVSVVDSPYFATTAETGAAVLNLPPGRYRLRVWNPDEAAAASPQEIKVPAAAMKIPVTLDLDTESRAVAAWPE